MRRIEIAVGHRQLRRWHVQLADRLTRLPGVTDVRFRLVSAGTPWPLGVRLLVETERRLLRRKTARLCDAVAPVEISVLERRAGPPDVVIVLTGEAPPSFGDAQVLQPRFDGTAGEGRVLDRLLGNHAPVVTIDDAKGVTLASGLPSLEASTGLTGKLEAVFSRVITLLETAVDAPRHRAAPPPVPNGDASPGPAAFLVRGLVRQGARLVQNTVVRPAHWRVGWRFVDGPGVRETGSLGGPPWQVLDGLGEAFAADPFPVEWQGRWWVFFERFDYAAQKGTIWVQELGAAGPLGPPRPALEAAWHLSYPQVIEHGGALYLLPEAARSRAVTLYRCVGFPDRWEPAAQLLEGVAAADSTVFRHQGRFWMTSVVRPDTGGYSDTLVIHHAADLFGPWLSHELKPALIDARWARPAGAVFQRDGSLYRPVQDCSDGYGRRVAIMRIDALDERRFEQTQVAVLGPGPEWRGTRLHTVNRWGRLECVDGAVAVPRGRALRRAAARLGWSVAHA